MPYNFQFWYLIMWKEKVVVMHQHKWQSEHSFLDSYKHRILRNKKAETHKENDTMSQLILNLVDTFLCSSIEQRVLKTLKNYKIYGLK